MSDIRPDQLDALFAALADGSISDTDAESLASTLRDNPAAQDAYLDYLELHSTLAWSLTTPRPITLTTTTKPHADAKPAPGEASGTAPASPYPIYRKGHEPKPTRFRPNHYALTGLAAALLAACGVAIYLLAFSRPTTPDPTPSQPGPPVATLIQNTGDLRTPHGFPVEGDDFSAGEYTLTSGGAEFMLTNAVNVKLRGEARLVMRNDMNVVLTRGSGDFVVPKDAIGFTVHLPGGARVVDLGTRFRVSVDNHGNATVRVLDGIVRVEDHDGQSLGLVDTQSARILDGRLAAIPPRDVALVELGIETLPEIVRFAPEAPASVVEGNTEDDDIVLFVERTGLELPKDTPVGIAGPFRYSDGGPYKAFKTDRPMRVDVFMVHFDPSQSDDTDTRRSATMRFERPILGVVALVGLLHTDATFGHPTTRYATDESRTIEGADDFEISDDLRTLTVWFNAESDRDIDQVRVLVEADAHDEK